jgi:hypothetical protein
MDDLAEHIDCARCGDSVPKWTSHATAYGNICDECWVEQRREYPWSSE